MEEKLQKIVFSVLESFGIDAEVFSIEHPADFSMGDYATNAAMLYAKELNLSPKELAEKIVSEISKKRNLTEEGIEKIEVAGPGFINFYLSKDFFGAKISEILNEGQDFGRSSANSGKKVIVEFSSPNIAKPFTVGHLRSTIIGDSIAKILSFSGYEVIRDNHLGDWGTQFGKLIVAIKRYGNIEEIAGGLRPVKELVDLYVKFHEEAEKDPTLEDEARAWFTKLEHNDMEARALWQRCVDWSIVEFEKIYRRLNVSFDTMLGESFFEDKMKGIIADLDSKDFYKESEGAKLIFFRDEILPPLMIQKKDGSTLYATRDLATDKYRKETYNPDLVINEVGIEQSLYFKQIFEAEEMLGIFKKDQRVHVAHGLYRFKDGKMSTRKGNVIWLEEILEEAVKKAEAINKDSAEVVGIGAIKWNDLKSECKKDIIFSWEDILNLEGDSGPYVQYSFARTQAILNKAQELNLKIDNSVQESWQTVNLEKLLYRFPEITKKACNNFAPHQIAQYILLVSREFNSFYGSTKILDKEDQSSSYKLALTKATSIVLKNGLNLLGIEAPEKM